jgi:hypothetical protein
MKGFIITAVVCMYICDSKNKLDDQVYVDIKEEHTKYNGKDSLHKL